MKKPAIHPAADLLPMMSESEYLALKQDMESNGLQKPIERYEGKILDGRNRQRACDELKIEPRYIDLKNIACPYRYVYSNAVHRNMSDSQKAAAAVGFLDHLVEQGNAKKVANGKQIKGEPWPVKTRVKMAGAFVTILSYRNGNVTFQEHRGSQKVTMPVADLKEMVSEVEPVPPGDTAKSRDVVGGLFGVSGRYIQDAKLLRQKSPKLFEQVFNGALPITRAKREAFRHERTRAMKKKAAAAPVNPDACEVITGDCIEMANAQPCASARLIFCDPQYNIGFKYGHGIKDDLSAPDYLMQVRKWVVEAHRLLTNDGSLWVLICDEWAAQYALILEELRFYRRNWIKWFESFGNNCASKFNRTSRHLFYCTKHPTSFVFDAAAVNRPSDRQAKYNDSRAVKGGKIWDDVWGINPPISRLVDNAAERIPGFPTQLPLDLLRPIVNCASEPGDLVMDFFTGSGTTAIAALESGRRFLGFEKEPHYADMARKRIRIAANAAERK